MPKPMKIMVEVEEFAFGRVFRILDGMEGVVAIQPIGDGVKAKAKQPMKQGGAGTVPCLILGALIAAKKALGREPLGKVLVDGGKAVTSLPDSLNKLKKEKEIITVGEGRDVAYKITAAGVKRYETACAVQS